MARQIIRSPSDKEDAQEVVTVQCLDRVCLEFGIASSAWLTRDRSLAMPNYFEPRKFELWRGRSIYEFLGVRFFKKHLLPTELLILRLRGRKALQRRQGVLKAELKRLEWETKRNEVIHWLALLLIGCILILKLSLSASPHFSSVQFVGIFAINLYVNIYPIFLQRYNRFRIRRLLGESRP